MRADKPAHFHPCWLVIGMAAIATTVFFATTVRIITTVLASNVARRELPHQNLTRQRRNGFLGNISSLARQASIQNPMLTIAKSREVAQEMAILKSMVPSTAPQASDSIDATWQTIDQVLEECAQLAATACDAIEFYAALMPRVVFAASAAGGVVWRGEASKLKLQATFGQVAGHDDVLAIAEGHVAQIIRELERSPHAPAEIASPLLNFEDNTFAFVAIVAAVAVDGQTLHVLEILVGDDTPPGQRKSQAAILGAFAELAAEFHRRRSVEDWRGQVSQWRRLNEFILRVYRRLDRRECCFVAANELRQAVECERVTLLCARGSRFRVEAVSNLDTFDPRSSVVRELERLATAVAHDDQPLWYSEPSSSGLPTREPRTSDLQTRDETATHPTRDDSADARNGRPKLQGDLEILQPYIDQSMVRAMSVVPLRVTVTSSDESQAKTIGVAVFERFEQRPFSTDEMVQVQRYSEHTAAALARAVELERMPLWGLSHALSKLGGLVAPLARANRIVMTVAIVAALGVFAAWPVEFNVYTTGILYPQERREIFAPADGVVRELAVSQGDKVEAGTLLLAMDNDDLEAEIARLLGELQTARRQLQVVRTSRLDSAKPDPSVSEPRGRLAGEEERLKEVVHSLEVETELRQRQREQLSVRSPIAGRVLTWDIAQSLRSRPLKRGQRLMTVANVQGPWILEMRVADADVGHVVQGKQRANSPLPVAFVAASAPVNEHRALLRDVSDWADVHDPAGPSVRMTAEVVDAASLAARPGATVSARIELGRRARAYVWLRDAIEFVRMRMWW